MSFSHHIKKINLASRVLELEPAWKDNPKDPKLDRELSLAGNIFGANPFKTAAAIQNNEEAEIIYQLSGIPSDEAPFHILDKSLILEKELVESLAAIYQEFQDKFKLPKEAREFDTDYQYSLAKGTAMPAVQIDMAALSPDEIQAALKMSTTERHDFLIGKIFEIEGSIAAYGMLSNLFNQTAAKNINSSDWGVNWRKMIDSYRTTYQKPVVLLAASQEKYESMLGYEFGLTAEQIAAGLHPTPEQVKLITGFDDYWGPAAYQNYVEQLPAWTGQNLPAEHPLLYVRASNPVEKMKDPSFELKDSILDNPKLRQLIRAFSLTTNIDNPSAPFSSHVNDTKSYMSAMNLAFEVNLEDPDVKLWISNQTNSNGSGSLKLMGKNKDNTFILRLRDFLVSRGIDPEGDFYLRAKPMVDVFGGYGQLKLKFQSGRPGKMNILEREMLQRGPYVLQPELISNSRIDAAATEHREIWRLFFGSLATEPENKQIFPIAGLVNSIPATSIEIRGKVERVHGNIGASFREVKLN